MRLRALASLLASVALLMACATGSAAPSATQVPAMAPPAAGREQLPDQQVLQVLNRLGYGPRPGDVARVRAMGVDRWITLQLTPDKIDDRVADRALARYQALDASTADIVQASRAAQQARRANKAQEGSADTASQARAANRRRGGDPDARALQQRAMAPVRELESATLTRAVLSNRQLYEQMVNFWENHFSVFVGKGQTRSYLLAYDRDVIRPHALGKFRDLLGAVAHSPAMLFYLDNWESQADSTHSTLAANGRVVSATQRRAVMDRMANGRGNRLPPRIRSLPPDQRQQALARLQKAGTRGLNENYGRELMELHTLGVDGGYTQQDVIEVARCLTGWSINPRTGAFVFRPEWHDADAKVVLGHRIPAGRGEEDGEQVLDILASSPATARFIARKLVVHFVSDSPPPALVERAAQTYLKTDGDIREVLRTIVTSPEFFSNAAYRAKVKTPFEVVASGLRVMNAVPDTTARLAGLVALLGQPEFGRLTPDGWPDRADAWMNTGAILNRINFGLLLASGRLPGASFSNWPYAHSLRDAPHAQQVDGVITHILGGEASQVTRDVLMTGRNPLLDQAQDDSLVGMAGTPRPEEAGGGRGGRGGRGPGILTRPLDLTGLPLVVGLALGTPEFQRR
ncbi:MAG TPA: DUF1800 domain-containing protein [Gemmatimonadaceae bacterium]|nr:DUF1800 domain-containing protein [Gemmatimonadaceae bacterium]